MENLITSLLALSDPQFDAVIAAASAARRVVGPPKNLGRPRGSQNKPKGEPAPQAPLIEPDYSKVGAA